jgi:predicted Zn-dependent protease
LSSGDEDAAILLMLDESASASQAADQFVQKSNAMVQTREPLTVNGFQAQRLVCRLPQESDTLQAVSYFIAKGEKVFTMHGLSSRDKFSQYSGVFNRTLGGFKQLNEPSKINVKPKKLAVRAVNRAATLRAVLGQFGVADDKLEDLAIMNGMKLDETVPAGTLIKVPTY